MRRRKRKERAKAEKAAPLTRRARRPRVKALAGLVIAGVGSLALRAALRLARKRRDRDRLRHAEGEPTERPPE